MITQMSEQEQWDEVMRMAEEYGLIIQAYGGTAILMSHDEQRKQDIDDSHTSYFPIIPQKEK